MRITLLILMSLIYCQVNGQRDLKIYVEDYNKDGVVDTLKTYYDGGSGFGGKFVELVNGKTNEVHKIDRFVSFGEMRYTIILPPELDKIDNELFLKAIKKELLPKKRSVPEGSLNWIIQGIQSNKELDDNPFFNLIIDPQTKWDKNELELPINYYVDIEGQMLFRVGNTSNEFFEGYDIEKDSKGFLVYEAHNHYRSKSGDSLDFSGSKLYYKVFHTSHGVVVKTSDSHKWVFVTDPSLTGGPEKLRWESVKSVLLYRQYLVVHHYSNPEDRDQFFIINIETGLCGRLKPSIHNPNKEFIHTMQTPYLRERTGEIIFDSEGGQFTYNLGDIFKELEKQYIEE